VGRLGWIIQNAPGVGRCGVRGSVDCRAAKGTFVPLRVTVVSFSWACYRDFRVLGDIVVRMISLLSLFRHLFRSVYVIVGYGFYSSSVPKLLYT